MAESRRIAAGDVLPLLTRSALMDILGMFNVSNVTGALAANSNLSDVANAATALRNLGLTDAGGKLLASLLPALAISDVFPVTSQAAMLALTAQRGDTAVRTDEGRAYILSKDDPAALANWIAVPLPAGVVMQIAGLNGPAITKEQLKTAIAITLNDVSGFSDAGRNLVAQGNYTAMTSLFSVYENSDGTNMGKKGLVPAPSVADRAAGRILSAFGWIDPPITHKSISVDNADTTLLADITYVGIVAMDKPVRIILPASNTYSREKTLYVADESGACSADTGITITVAASGADTIAGQPSILLGSPYQKLAFHSNGSNLWTFA